MTGDEADRWKDEMKERDAETWTMAGDDGKCVRCGSDAGFDYMGGCFTCLDVGGQELPLEAESFEAEGSHFEDIHYESDTYPLNPTRPSGPWPMPSPRPRRPNRRPNRRPSPRPQRRPF